MINGFTCKTSKFEILLRRLIIINTLYHIIKKKQNLKNGLRKYPASEYSDRVINLNKLEDRNLENQLKYIEKERKVTISTITRDIKRLENDYEEKKDSLKMIYNQERLKTLNSNLHIKMLIKNNSNYIEKLKQIGLIEIEKTTTEDNTKLVVENSDNIVRFKKNLSANARLNLYSSSSNENDANSAVRPRSALDNYETSNPLTSNSNKAKENKPNVNQRPSSSLLEARKPKPISSQLSSSATNIAILPKHPIEVRGKVLRNENNLKKNFETTSFKETFAPTWTSSKPESPVLSGYYLEATLDDADELFSLV